METGKAPNIPIPPAAALGYQNGTAIADHGFCDNHFRCNQGLDGSQPKGLPRSSSYCGDSLGTHPRQPIVRLLQYRHDERATNPNQRLPFQSYLGEACGVDPATASRLPATRNDVDRWGHNHLGSADLTTSGRTSSSIRARANFREDTMSAANRPTLNGTMHYIEIDGKNLANWFAGKIGTIVTTGQATKDPSDASNNFVLYVSDRRGNYEDPTVQTITGGWPPLSYTLA